MFKLELKKEVAPVCFSEVAIWKVSPTLSHVAATPSPSCLSVLPPTCEHKNFKHSSSVPNILLLFPTQGSSAPTYAPNATPIRSQHAEHEHGNHVLTGKS